MANILRQLKTLATYGAVGYAASRLLKPRTALNQALNDEIHQNITKKDGISGDNAQIEAMVNKTKEVDQRQNPYHYLEVKKKADIDKSKQYFIELFCELIGEDEMVWFYRDADNQCHCIKARGLHAQQFFRLMADMTKESAVNPNISQVLEFED